MECKNKDERWPHPTKLSFLTEDEMKKLNTQRINAYRRKLYKLTKVSDDYVWDCECSACMHEKEWYNKAIQQIERTKKILKGREHLDKAIPKHSSILDNHGIVKGKKPYVNTIRAGKLAKVRKKI